MLGFLDNLPHNDNLYSSSHVTSLLQVVLIQRLLIQRSLIRHYCIIILRRGTSRNRAPTLTGHQYALR